MARGAAIPLAGRDAELSVLVDVVEDAIRGPSRVAVVEGEAGIGKSRLLEEAIAHAVRRGYRVFSGAAEELERNQPLAPLARAFGAELELGTAVRRTGAPPRRQLGTPNAGRIEPGVADNGALLVEEFVAVLAHQARERPVVLALDDLQWADPATLLAMRALTRRVADLSVVVLLAARPSPRNRDLSSFLDALLRGGALHLILGPLDDKAVAALVASLLGGVPGMRLRAEAARGGGNPLWVLELAAALARAGALTIQDGHVEFEKGDLPASLRLTILRRLSFLSDDALHVLRLGAVLGSSFDPQDLAISMGCSVAEVLPALQEAIRAGIVGEAGPRLVFRHDLVWEVIYEDLAVPLRRGLHLEAGRALARVGRPAAQVAVHFGIGASPGDAEAVEWLRRAAREAAALAPHVAAELLDQALRLVEPSDPQRDVLTAERVAALVRSGRADEAAALARDRLMWAPNSEVAGLLRWGLASALQIQGRLAEALEETMRAVNAPGLAPGRRARLQAEASQWSFYTGDPATATSLAEDAISAGESHGDDAAVCLGLTSLSRIALDELDFPRAISLSSRALDRARESGLQRLSIDWIHPTFDLGGALITADQLNEADETLRAGRRLREELGSSWDLPLFTGALAHAQLYAGRWDDAVAEAKTALAMAEEGATKGNLIWTHSLLAYVSFHRGDLEGVNEALRAADRAGGVSAAAMASDALNWCKGLLCEAQGDLPGATDLMLEAWERPLPFKAVVHVRMAPDLVRVAMATGANAEARTVAEATGRMAERTGSPLYEGVADRCRGLLDNDPSVLLGAVVALRRSNRPVELAFALEDAGLALGRAGRVADGVALVREALCTYQDVAAGRDVARAEAVLRGLGVRSGRRGPRSKQTTGWGSLTRSERDVVALVVQGLTNAEIGTRLFVSPRTVETHLSHLYRKLGVTSRVGLAAEAARRTQGDGGLPDGPST